ncbi:MAG: hypothetical protein RID81_07005 [Sandaracinaceae bacterium]
MTTEIGHALRAAALLAASEPADVDPIGRFMVDGHVMVDEEARRLGVKGAPGLLLAARRVRDSLDASEGPEGPEGDDAAATAYPAPVAPYSRSHAELLAAADETAAKLDRAFGSRVWRETPDADGPMVEALSDRFYDGSPNPADALHVRNVVDFYFADPANTR